MARIVLTCWGSHGDIDPFIGLGEALRSRGHAVVLATIEFYRPLAEASGFEFHAIRPRVDPTDTAIVERIMDRNRGSDFLLKEVMFPNIEAMFEDLDAAVGGADLLVSHPLTFAAPIVAERRGMPWANVVLAPTSFFSTWDYPVLPPAPWIKSLQRFGHWPGRLVVGLARRVTRAWPEPLYQLRERLGLPRGKHPVFDGQHSPYLVLALYSQLLGDPQPDWPANVVITGHAFHDAVHGTALSPDLDAFLTAGPPPIVFTLGSSVVLIAKDFWRESLDAVRRLDARAVFLAGPMQAAELRGSLDERDRARVLVIDRAPHSLLFPRASVVVQQCGIGTLAQGLRGGRPILAVPYAHDQPDNAWRAERLGVARIVHPSRYRGARVAKALTDLRQDGRYADAARRVAAAVRREGGVQAACDAIARSFALA